MTPLLSPLLTRHGFRHAFFTREGGVSEGPYATLNFAWSTGDDEGRVRENLARAAAYLGVPADKVFFLSQTHGIDVHRVGAADDRELVVRKEGDAVVSTDARVAAGVRVADCVPVLVADVKSGGVVAIHSGWRGTVADIVAAGVRALREVVPAGAELIAAVGPHLSVAGFEIGEDVAQTIERASPVPDVIDRTSYAKPHADLRRVVDAQLRRAGISEIDHVEGCTYLDAARFFSFRRDGQKSGRHLAAIVPR